MIGQRAIVIGAGIAGLASARALSDGFEQVVLLERDTPSRDASPRSGVPQGKQPHALLAGGHHALSGLFPAFTRNLVKAGAVSYDYTKVRFEIGGIGPLPQRDLGNSGPLRNSSRCPAGARARLIPYVLQVVVVEAGEANMAIECRYEQLTTLLSSSSTIRPPRLYWMRTAAPVIEGFWPAACAPDCMLWMVCATRDPPEETLMTVAPG